MVKSKSEIDNLTIYDLLFHLNWITEQTNSKL